MKLKRKGFTLVELLFGTAILLVATVVSLGAFINCMLLNESNRNFTTAAHDAQSVLEQLKTQSFGNIPSYIASYPSTQFNNLPGENVTFPSPVYTATLDTVTVQITWNEGTIQKSLSIATRFAQ